MPRPRGRLGLAFYRKLTDQQKTYFKGVLDGTNEYKVTRKPAATELKRYNCAIIPFGVTPGTDVAAAKVLVNPTAQALKIAKAFDSSLNIFALDTSPANTTGAEDGFYPALCKLTVRPTTVTIDNRKSQFTDKEYKYKPSRSGSIPFGRGTTTVTDAKTSVAETTIDQADYEDVRSSIEKAVRQATLTGLTYSSMSFTPEYWDIITKPANGLGSTVSGTVSF